MKIFSLTFNDDTGIPYSSLYLSKMLAEADAEDWVGSYHPKHPERQWREIIEDWDEIDTINLEEHDLPFRSFTDLSTIHVTQSEILDFERNQSIYRNDTGYMMHLSAAPERFQYLETDYVCFDADAPIDPRFPQFEDEWQ